MVADIFEGQRDIRSSTAPLRSALPQPVEQAARQTVTPRGIARIVDLYRKSERRPGSDCWHWLGAKATDGTPRIWTLDHERGEKRGMSGPKAVWNIANSSAPPAGMLVYRSCFSTDCVNPMHHLLAASKAEIGARIVERGVRKGTHVEQRRANVHKAHVATGKLTPPEVVLAVRRDSGTLTEIGARHGINRSTASRIRRGDSHRHLLEAA